ncbi:MAG: bifunctional nicotinamidase/pyrazinamidase [Promethearchaeota archaeon]
MDLDDLSLEKNISVNENDAFIVVDIQNDFIPGGALPVEEGDTIIENINHIATIFYEKNAKIVFTQDWHPRNHLSFASMHPGKEPGDEFQSDDGSIGPILWPDHCVQGTEGARFHDNLETVWGALIIRKGTNPNIDSYSAFLENDQKTETGLAGYLKSLNIKRIFIAGLALDYCCYYTAIDGLKLGFEVHFFIDLAKGIDAPEGNISNSLRDMVDNGVKFININGIKK